MEDVPSRFRCRLSRRPGSSLYRRPSAFPHSISWVRTVLLSVGVAGSFAFLSGARRSIRRRARCRQTSAVVYASVPLAPPQPTGGSRGRGIRTLRGSRRGARRSRATRSLARNGIENPPQASEADIAAAKPRCGTEMRGRFRGGGDCVDDQPSGVDRGRVAYHVRFPLASHSLHWKALLLHTISSKSSKGVARLEKFPLAPGPLQGKRSPCPSSFFSLTDDRRGDACVTPTTP